MANHQPTQQFFSSPPTLVDPWAQKLAELHSPAQPVQAWPKPQPSVQPPAQPVASWSNQQPSVQPPAQTLGSWSSQQPSVQPPAQTLGSWSNQQPSNWQFSAPITRDGPVVQSARKTRGKWRGLTAWTLWVFGGGLVAGPLLTEYADQGMTAGIAWVSTWAPGFLRPYLPLPLDEAASPPQAAVRERPAAPAPSAAAPVQPPPAATAERPAAPVPSSRPAPEPASQPKAASDSAAQRTAKAASASAPKPAVEHAPKAAVASAPKPAVEHAPKATPPRLAHPAHGRAASATFALNAHAPASKAKPAGQPRAERNDPFDNDEAVAPKRPAKPAPEPAPMPRSSARSSDGLDDLMAGVGGGTASKGKHSTSREIDAMLKDVQKSEPPPPPKRAEPAPLPPLSAADIATAMSGVKSSANACGKRFGRSGAADLKLTVGKEGRVTDVAVRGGLADGPIAQCIAKAARGATFPRNAGLKFDYRITVQ